MKIIRVKPRKDGRVLVSLLFGASRPGSEHVLRKVVTIDQLEKWKAQIASERSQGS